MINSNLWKVGCKPGRELDTSAPEPLGIKNYKKSWTRLALPSKNNQNEGGCLIVRFLVIYCQLLSENIQSQQTIFLIYFDKA